MLAPYPCSRIEARQHDSWCLTFEGQGRAASRKKFAAAVENRFCNRRDVILGVSFLVRYADFRNDEGDRLILGMYGLNGCGTEQGTCDNCQSECDVTIHGVLLWLFEPWG